MDFMTRNFVIGDYKIADSGFCGYIITRANFSSEMEV